jgi:cobalamin biosynthesis protein CobD/CbiB
MGFFALVLALLLEQLRPLRPGNRVHGACVGFAAWVRGKLDGGERRHGLLGWLVVVAAGLALVCLAEALAQAVHPLALFALHVFVLYCTVGFRQFSEAFTEIRVALAADDSAEARRVLAGWLRDADPDGEPPALPEATVSGTCRAAIAHALLVAHRHVLGPLFCYVVLPGAIGPVLYRIAEMLARHWRRETDPAGSADPSAAPAAPGTPGAATPASAWPDFAVRAYAFIDWIPVRVTAIGFAIVGNFDDALYCWRGASAAAGHWHARSLLLAAGSGALGVCLADGSLLQRWAAAAPAFECPGGEPQAANLATAASLVWRSLVLWIGLYALITVSAWMGH